jgi:cold shock protein
MSAVACAPDAPLSGTIRWYSHERGFGFIEAAGTRDIFFHVTKIRKQTGQPDIFVGRPVEFSLKTAANGQPQAAWVQLL